MREFEDHLLPNNKKAKSDEPEPKGVEEGDPVSEKDGEDVITSDPEETSPVLGFPVVALGASAGGLEAFRDVLQNLAIDSGMAFVLIQHLSPQHPSQLTSLLARVTSMPVSEVQHGTRAEPNHVYIIPPNTLMTISQGVLELVPRPEGRSVPMPINHFLRSLAQDQKALAVGVVLSGTDSDGAQGLQAIREYGGIAIAQSEDSAKFAGMPHNAVEAGTVDLILPPGEIARALGRIGQRQLLKETEPIDTEPEDERSFNTILGLLRKATGIDFRGYQPATLHRRIARRTIVQRETGLAEYAARLEADHAELLALYEDILINVTSFFRDPDTFLALERKILPELLRNRSSDVGLRIWAPGCSSGEEVYSIAICLVEAVSKLPSPMPIQVFGTDLSERVLARARSAIYQTNQLAPVSADRRRQYFTQLENGYQVIKSIRELCVFARQNVCEDPPFSRLDLISCRNLLIYLGPGLQQRTIATFHYALKPGGYLMLGRSESLRDVLFSAVDKQHKLFQRAGSGRPSRAMMGRGFTTEQAPGVSASDDPSKPRSSELGFERKAEQIVLRDYGPPWVVVNENFEIVHTRGDTRRFLQLPSGSPSFELLKMARESLRGPLRKLLIEAKDTNAGPQSSSIQEMADGEMQQIGLEVRRVPGQTSDRPCFLVVFAFSAKPAVEAERGPESTPIRSEGRSQALETESLRDELTFTRQRLQLIIDERDAANQELTSANEEIQSSNEELQSINEELETAKEELQSSNEELSTLNEELQNQNQELNRIGDDLSNLMSSTTIPLLLLDSGLCIRRMTPIAESALGIRPGDLGRPIGDVRMRLSVDDVETLARSVLLTFQPKEVELQDREGNWRELRIRPYRTADNRIEGVVLVLIDIDQLRRAKMEATVTRDFAESLIQTVQTPLLVLRDNLDVRLANRAFYREYGLSPAEVENQSLLEIDRKRWNLPGLSTALEKVLETGETILDLEFEIGAVDQSKTLCIQLSPVQSESETLILVAIEDITSQKDAARILFAKQEQLESSVEAGTMALRETETALLRSREKLRELAASLLNAQESERRRISRELHDDLSQKLAKLQFDIETLEQKATFADVELVKGALSNVRDQTGSLANDLRRVAHGLHPSSLDHLGLGVALRSYAEEFSRSTTIPVEFTSRDLPEKIPMDVSSCLYRIVQEALRNVGKHAPQAAVTITLVGIPEGLDLLIRDTGEGFDVRPVREIRGLGLISMQERVRLVQGRFALTTSPGKGVQISIQIPLRPEADQ